MTDVSPVVNQMEQAKANDNDEQSNGFLNRILQEVQCILGFRAGSHDAPMSASSSQSGDRSLVPDLAISSPGTDLSAFAGTKAGQPIMPKIELDPSTSGVERVSQQNAPSIDLSPYAYAGDSAGQQNAPSIDLDPYAYGGDGVGQQNSPAIDLDPYDYGGDTTRQQNVPTFDPQLNKLPSPEPDVPPSKPDVPPSKPDAPPSKPDAPAPEGDKQTKMGDRMFTVHPDGSAEYTVAKGDCVWFVATDVLKSRTGKKPDDAHIIAEVNAIAAASGLTKNGRNPDLIFPGDKLVIPPAEKPQPKP